MKNTQPQFPAEEVTLPSKGLLYPENSSIRSGKIEMKYMTAREEDILTNQNYIKNGVAIDKLLKSLIISPINFDDLLLGDKNAIMIAARILRYGAEYEIRKIHPQTGMESDGIIDLSKIKDLKNISRNEMILDIGPKTIKKIKYSEKIKKDYEKHPSEFL